MNTEHNDIETNAARYHAQKQGEEDADHALPVIVWVLGVVFLTLVIILTATPFWLPWVVQVMGG